MPSGFSTWSPNTTFTNRTAHDPKIHTTLLNVNPQMAGTTLSVAPSSSSNFSSTCAAPLFPFVVVLGDQETRDGTPEKGIVPVSTRKSH